MLIPRVIPCLLLRGSGLYKGERFRHHRYVGDPINAVRIFNEMEADELFFLDIMATAERRIPSLELIQQIAEECFMPFTVGGGIRSVENARTLLYCGAEKICINTAAVETPEIIKEIALEFGSQSVVVSIDVKRKHNRKSKVFIRCGHRSTNVNPVDHARKLEELGAGELLITDISREGSMKGYNLDLISLISEAVSIPVIASGGAGTINDFSMVLSQTGAVAVAAGSMFVFHGSKRAVLISYPERYQLERVFSS